MAFLDALSVATRGFLEADLIAGAGTPGTPTAQISEPRDELRYATRGYLVLDLTALPDPGTVMCIEILDDGRTDAVVDPVFTDAEIDPTSTGATIAVAYTDAECEPDGPTDAKFQDPC